MVPVGIAQIEPDANPAVAETGGAVVSVFVGIDQHRLLLRAADFDQQRGHAVAVMVVGDISEFLAADNAKAGHSVRQRFFGLGLLHRKFADF